MFVSADHPFITEDKPHEFSCFASDVEPFREGFPRVVKTNIGNGQPFIATTKKVVEGDVQYARYVQQLGCVTLKVFND